MDFIKPQLKKAYNISDDDFVVFLDFYKKGLVIPGFNNLDVPSNTILVENITKKQFKLLIDCICEKRNLNINNKSLDIQSDYDVVLTFLKLVRNNDIAECIEYLCEKTVLSEISHVYIYPDFTLLRILSNKKFFMMLPLDIRDEVLSVFEKCIQKKKENDGFYDYAAIYLLVLNLNYELKNIPKITVFSKFISDVNRIYPYFGMILKFYTGGNLNE